MVYRDPPHFTPPQNPLLPFTQILIININIGVLLLNTLLLYVVAKSKSLPLIHQILHSVGAIGHCTVAVALITGSLYASLGREILSGKVCWISAMLFHMGLYTTLATTTTLAISKYYAITRLLQQRPPPRNKVWLGLLFLFFSGIWAHSILLGLKMSSTLMPSQTYCQMVSPVMSFASLLALSEFFASLLLILIYYIALTVVLRSKLNETKALNSNLTEDFGAEILIPFQESVRKQTTAINQSLLFAGGFYTFYSVEIVAVIYSAVFQESRPPLMDAIAVVLLSSNGLLNPIVLLFFNPAVHRELIALLNIVVPDPIGASFPTEGSPSLIDYEFVKEDMDSLYRSNRPVSAPPAPRRPDSIFSTPVTKSSYENSVFCSSQTPCLND